MIYKFTARAKKALEKSKEFAKMLSHNYIGTEHILYGLVAEGNGIASRVLENNGISETKIEGVVIKLVDIGDIRGYDGSSLEFTPRAKKVIENSYLEAKKAGYEYIGTEHLLLSILKDEDGIGQRVLLELDVNAQKLYNELIETMNGLDNDNWKTDKNLNKQKPVNKETPTLSKYGIDLTQKAKEGKLDPVIGREKETRRLIQILSRRRKNNPCLIGEPGVRKNSYC